MTAARPVGAEGAGIEVRAEPFPEHELPEQVRTAFTECQQHQSSGAQWLGSGSGRRLSLPSGITFFPLPVRMSPIGLVAGITLLCLGLVAIGMGVAAPLVEGPQAVVVGVVVGLFGVAMFVAAVLLFRVMSKRKKEQLARVQPFGLYLLQNVLVLRLPPTPAAPEVGSSCQLYPRAAISVDKWQGFGGAGTSSQASGSTAARVRIRWTHADGSTGERLLDWPLGGLHDDDLLTTLRAWCR